MARLSFGQQQIISHFENANADNFQIISEPTEAYNCISWALEDINHNWDFLRRGGQWHPLVPKSYHIDSIVLLFKANGFERCSSFSFEPDFVKLAIYTKNTDFQHVARQLPNGKWTSKLGEEHDIEHEDLAVLEGQEYGQVSLFMRKPLNLKLSSD